MKPGQTITILTSLGQYQIQLDAARAPVTAHYFEQLAREGKFDNTFIFRIVNSENNSHNPNYPIHVVQGGGRESDPNLSCSIVHESTLMTGITHKKWTVSAARMEAGEVYGSFFIAMRDEPSLDYGGERHSDGQGFAAFGEVSSGYSVLEKIFLRAESDEYLANPIPIVRARSE